MLEYVITRTDGREEQQKQKKSADKKMYLLLYNYTDETGEEHKTYEKFEGRDSVYNFIKNLIENLDIYTSEVLVETVTCADAISVYDFMKYASQFYPEDSFDIEDYNYGDVD